MPVYDPMQGYLPTYTPADPTTGGALPSLPFGPAGGAAPPPVVPPVTGGGGDGGGGGAATRDERISRVMRMLRDPVYRALIERELGTRDWRDRSGPGRERG